MAVGIDEVDVLTAVASPVTVERTAGPRARPCGRIRQVVVDPSRSGVDIELMDVAIGVDEIHVLAVVASPITVESAARRRQNAAAENREIVVDPIGSGMNVQLVDVAVDVDEIHVLAVVASPITVQCAAGCSRNAMAQNREVVVDPIGSGVDVHLVDVAVGVDEIDVLAVVASPITVERAAARGRNAVSQNREVIVDPVGSGVDVHFVDVAVGVDEIDVLTVVAPPITVQCAAGRSRNAIAQNREIVVDPPSPGMNVQLVDVAVGVDEIHVLAVVAPPITIKRAATRRGNPVAEERKIVIDPSGPGVNIQLVDVAVGVDEVDVLAAVAPPIAVERATLRRNHGREVVIDPSGSGVDVQLVHASAGINVIDVLAAVAPPIAVESAARRRGNAAAENREVVVDPIGSGVNVHLVDVAVDVDEIHVLAVVAPPITVERAAGRSRNAVTQNRQVVVDPSGPGVDIQLVDVAVGVDVIHVLAVVASPITIKRTATRRKNPLTEDREIVIDPSHSGVNVQLVDVAVGVDEIDVLAVVASPVTVERAAGRSRNAVAQNREVVVDPIGSGVDVHFVDVAVGVDEVDVLAAVAPPISVERAAGRSRNTMAQNREVVIDPIGSGVDVHFVDVAVGVDEVDVLTAIASPISVERAAGRSRSTVAQDREVVIDPSGPRMNVHFVDVAVGVDEVDVLTAIASPISVERTAGPCGAPPVKRVRSLFSHPSGLPPKKQYVPNGPPASVKISMSYMAESSIVGEPTTGIGPESGERSELSDQPEAQYLRSVARIGVQVAEALEYAHQQSILHRDIKPSNLLLDAQGEVWVTDFGLAKDQGSDELTRTGDIVGTLRYMAPERFNGWSDPRSDVYALGATLYEMLTLHPAFDESDRVKLIDRVLHESAVPLRQLDRRIPRNLETIVLKALAKEPGERYATAGQLAQDLQRFVVGKPILARRARISERAVKWARRRPAIAALLGLVVLATATGLGGVLWQWRAAVTARLDAERESGRAKVQTELAEQARRAEAAQRALAKAGEQRALEEKRIAEAVRTFLQQDLLEQANPGEQAEALRRAGGGFETIENPTIKELLDRAASQLTSGKIEAKFPGQLEVQASILKTVGTTYCGIGEFAKGVEFLTRSSEAYSHAIGANHADTLTCLDYLARAYLWAGKTVEAVKLFEQVRDARVKILGAGQPEILFTLHGLGEAYLSAGKTGEAVALYEHLRDACVNKLGPEHPQTLFALHGLATAYFSAGKTAEALALCVQRPRYVCEDAWGRPPSIPRRSAQPRPSAPSCRQDSRSHCPLRAGARRLCEEARGRPPVTLAVLDNLAEMHRDAGKTAEAIALFEQVRTRS